MKFYHWSKKDIVPMTVIIALLSGILSPFLYLFLFSPTKFGETVQCKSVSTEKQEYTKVTVEKVVLDPETYQDTNVRLTGKTAFYPKSGSFLRDGIFLVSLDLSSCEGIEAYRRGFSVWVDIQGKVMTKDDEFYILVDSFSETEPDWILALAGFSFIGFFPAGLLIFIRQRRAKKAALKAEAH